MRMMARNRQGADYWPGFVDALASLLLVIIFLLSFFMLAQFFLSHALTDRDSELLRLDARIAELTGLLDLERARADDLESEMGALRATLAETEARAAAAAGAGEEAAGLRSALEEERQVSEAARARIELLNQQIMAMRAQLASLQEALEASEARDAEAQAVIADLGRRLNAALAQRVQELARYRSEFFGRLRDILGERDDIRIVGDRFVFQSEVLFDTASAEISPQGRAELAKIAGAVRQIAEEIPDDIEWVLRIDGHTDIRPIRTAEFPSNWHLSSARAIAVVRYMASQGVPPDRLLAAGFGEFQPIDDRRTAEAYARNRRIEFKLTER
jgi:chemotaxis protein MotB